jgi:hypothetical protein
LSASSYQMSASNLANLDQTYIEWGRVSFSFQIGWQNKNLGVECRYIIAIAWKYLRLQIEDIFEGLGRPQSSKTKNMHRSVVHEIFNITARSPPKLDR